MRLTQKETVIIQSLAEETFGNNVQVRLFGSRVDKQKKGGDIDLLITPEKLDEVNSKEKINIYWAKLQEKLGEQKIDILLEIPDSKEKIIEVAKKTGILL